MASALTYTGAPADMPVCGHMSVEPPGADSFMDSTSPSMACLTICRIGPCRHSTHSTHPDCNVRPPVLLRTADCLTFSDCTSRVNTVGHGSSAELQTLRHSVPLVHSSSVLQTLRHATTGLMAQ
jgi:hypothetical protein